jgi:tetraacyldisaccharide 4'-kinase
VPVLAERDRLAAAARAVAAGADVLVLDDAFQHRRIKRDLDLLLISSEQWQSRPRLLPRGGWREPLSAAARASLIAVTRRSAPEAVAVRVTDELARHAPYVPIIRLELCSAGWLHQGRIAAPPTEPALAVAALANPSAFIENALAAGAAVADRQLWRDHHEYLADDAAAIMTRAGSCPVITTAKDWVKLERLLPAGRVWVLQQEVRVATGERELRTALDRVLAR